MADPFETQRQAIIRNLEEQERTLDAEAAHIHDKKAKVQAKKARFSAPLPEPNLCPDCWFEHGSKSYMSTRSAGRGADLWKCPDCGHEETHQV